MNIEIVIAALSLLIAALAEGRSIWKDQHNEAIRTNGITLLQLIQVLDKIIGAGRKLIEILSNIPIAENEDKTRFATLRKKKEIIAAIDEQIENLKLFENIYSRVLSVTNAKVPVTLRDSIQFFIPDKQQRVMGMKGSYLRVLTWKVMKGETLLSKLEFGINNALKTYVNGIEIEKELTVLSLNTPTKLKIEDSVKITNREIYDLKKTQDLRKLLSNAKDQLDEIEEFRNKIAEFVVANLSIKDLLATD